MNKLLRPALGQLIPLSEDSRLVLDAPRDLAVSEGEEGNWDEVTVMAPGERRVISLRIAVAPRARGRMVRVFEVPRAARLTILHQTKVEEGGEWKSVICVRGQGEVVIRRTTELCGPGACAVVTCAGVMEDSGLISVADETFALAADAKTELRTKVVLKDTARSEVRGRIVVDECATGSQAYERLDHLTLGEHVTAAAIPELEVHTDNVKCGHGATTSRPTEEEIFYVMSRGLSARAAEQLLAEGFVNEVLSDLPEAMAQKTREIFFS